MSDEREEALRKYREKREAYLHVFGQDGERTIYQQAVLDDISRMAGYGDTAMRFDKDGRFDGGATAYQIGKQDVVKRIHLRLTWREHEHGSDDPESSG